MIPKDLKCRLLSIPIEKVAEALGITIRRGHKALCPFHDDKHHPSLSFNVKNNYWYCFTCGEGGDTIELAMKMLNTNYVDTCKWLSDSLGIVCIGQRSYKRKLWKGVRTNIHHFVEKQNGQIFSPDIEVMEWVIDNAKLSEEAKFFLFEERKYKKEVIEQLRIGSLTHGEKFVNAIVGRFGIERALSSHIIKQTNYGIVPFCNTPSLLFPLYDQDGVIVNIQSRYLKKGNPRFLFVSGLESTLFNAPLLDKLKSGDKVVISEGVTDCLAWLSKGKNAIAFLGNQAFKQEYVQRLKDKRLYIFPDKGDSGEKFFESVCAGMAKVGCGVNRGKINYDKYKDVSEWYMDTLSLT